MTTVIHLQKVFVYKSIVNAGVNKNMSNDSTVENYKAAMKGMKDFHEFKRDVYVTSNV